MRKIIFLISTFVFLGCSKKENLGPSEQERNTMELQASAFISSKYIYTDPGLVINGTVIVPPSQKERHTAIVFNNDGKTYKTYFSSSGAVGFPYDEDAISLPYSIDFPKLFIEGQTVNIYRNSNGLLEFSLKNLIYTAKSK